MNVGTFITKSRFSKNFFHNTESMLDIAYCFSYIQYTRRFL